MAQRRDQFLEMTGRQKRVFLRAVRMAFFILITTVALVTMIQRYSDAGNDAPSYTTARPSSGSGSGGNVGKVVKEVQTLTVTGGSTGTYTLTYNGQTTPVLIYGVSTPSVQGALSALSNVGSGNITADGTPGVSGATVVTVTFGAQLPISLLVPTVLTGDVTFSVAEVTHGSAPVPRAAPVVIPAAVEVAWWVPVVIAVALFGIVLLIDVATPNKKISSIMGVLWGILAGIVATVAISAVIQLALQVWLPDRALQAIQPLILLIKPLLGIALCYLGISTVLQTQDDFRLVIPYVEFAKEIRGVKPNLLDTSALIDARIADVAATGLLQSALVIPRFVLAELQLLADSSDKLKRARGRRGLDVVTRLQRQGTLDVTIDETPVTAMAVDQMLVELARRLTARIITTDLGLTRVAQIHGVTVLNLHEIANTLKPALIPGEQMSIRLVKAGEQAGQGVGYLADGTMVVAEDAGAYIGTEVMLQVSSTLQTTAGRMVFARLLDGAAEAGKAEASAGAEPAALASEPPAHAEHDAAPEGDGMDDAGEAGVGGTGALAGKAKGGPFPPKHGQSRGPSPRNPRR